MQFKRVVRLPDGAKKSEPILREVLYAEIRVMGYTTILLIENSDQIDALQKQSNLGWKLVFYESDLLVLETTTITLVL